MLTLNCKGKILSSEIPLIMGIINTTPDSFFEGHLADAPDEMINRAERMIREGADILDIGGQSTKPGSKRIESDEELNRVIPVIRLLHTHFPDVILSVDTYYSNVAKIAVEAGASIINDISAGNMDANMITTVANLDVPYICMHMLGTPETMQQNPVYKDVTQDVLNFFIRKITDCKKAGIKDIIIDPGFGFGKTIQQNYQLLKEMSALQMLELPILAGLSRKGMIYKTLNVEAREALNGTTVLNTLALQNGAKILRVHDVKEAREAILLFEYYKNAAQ